MSTPNKDEVEGKFENVKGKVKEGVGNLTGDRDLEAEGEADQAKGKTQETWGKFKHGVGDAVDAVGDAVSNTGKKINK
ncbi:MAG: CsbD family protein [Acidobacteriota bacterium]|nr:CsbD family protein [Acidobacteriota bacterium]